ncbi:ABC transporter substrate-binding protein [Cytobacillus purgationiresistens]|uniref:Peptide/nickel transport system substrate-binding protein n=1 Tax=Cytobacillus purgationiresistens TaxID=863449 RepID=A0ABU0ADP4_9BACI|nr:ABC transporter substrate-binding protein [Cytobacillus purgationiresistens]MDQ0268220.1 peptide/nickel transport system substrate-binding protein [Cytobacillus purgationiresistens]
MKKKLTGFTMLLLTLFLVLAACSNDKDTTDEGKNESAGQEKDGGTLTVAVSDNPQVMNPLYANDRITLTVQQALYAPLYFMEEGGEKNFILAESFEPSEDQKTWTLKLKENLKWHDGEPITADDLVYTFESILDENQNSSIRGSLIFNGEPLKVEKVDDLTVDLILPQVSAAFEGVLVDFFPIPKHVFENETDLMQSELNQNPIGSGPFKFKEYKSDEYIVLERFDEYFAGKPKLDQIVYRIVKDPNTANISLQNGEVNMRLVEPQDAQKLEGTGKLNLHTFPEGRLFYLAFNLESKAVQNKELRQAVAHAIDKEEMIQAAFVSDEFADPAASIFTPDTMYHTEDITTYNYNQDTAKKLLEEGGIEEGHTLKVIYANNNKIMESLALYTQQKLQEIGLKVDLTPMDPSAYGQKTLDMAATDYDISYGGYIMGSEPDVYKTLFQSDAAYNYGRYKNAEFDQLWEDAAVEVDKDAREALYKDIQETVAEDVPYLPLAYPQAILAVDKRFGGIDEAKPIPVTMVEDLSKIYEVE